MKNTIRIIALVLLVAALSLMGVACSREPGLEKIEVEGYQDSFFVGDSFTTGEGFKVYAVYDDGSRVDVTAEATIKQENGMDMSAAGDYMITVEYGGKKTVYTIEVNASAPALKQLTLDTTGVKTAYKLGETFTYEGLGGVAIYESEQGKRSEESITSFKGYIVTVTDADGTVVKGAFPEIGTYTVTVAKGEVSASYEVTVSGADTASMAGAVLVAQYGADRVSGGQMTITDTIAGSVTSDFRYAFGENYTYIQAGEGGGERHYSLDENGKLISVVLDGGSIVPDATAVAEAMKGVPITLWWHENTEYGIEAAIANLYERGKNDPNGDYTETIDETTRTYSFSYGYVMTRITGVEGDDYFFVNSVTFTLDENYALISATLSQTQYINYASSEDAPNYLVDADGHAGVAPGATSSSKIDISATQTVGERTAENPYSKDKLTVESFNIYYDGQLFGEDDVIYGEAGQDVTIRIADILPETASFTVDTLYYSDGVSKAESTIFVGTGFTAHRKGDSMVVNIRLSKGGEWELVLSTEKVTRRVKLSITGAAPTTLTSELYNTAFGSFSKANGVTSLVGSSALFLAEPDQYADGAYSVSVEAKNGGDATAVTLTETTVNGVDCWSFSASKAGEYEVLMTSKRAPDVTCKLTFTVVDIPNLSEVFNNTWHTTDNEGGVYELVFTGTQEGELVKGELVASYTKDGATKTQTLRYTVSESNLSLELEPVSGEALGLDIKVDSAGRLVLEDQYESKYILG